MTALSKIESVIKFPKAVYLPAPHGHLKQEKSTWLIEFCSCRLLWECACICCLPHCFLEVSYITLYCMLVQNRECRLGQFTCPFEGIILKNKSGFLRCGRKMNNLNIWNFSMCIFLIMDLKLVSLKQNTMYANWDLENKFKDIF